MASATKPMALRLAVGGEGTRKHGRWFFHAGAVADSEEWRRPGDLRETDDVEDELQTVSRLRSGGIVMARIKSCAWG